MLLLTCDFETEALLIIEMASVCEFVTGVAAFTALAQLVLVLYTKQFSSIHFRVLFRIRPLLH